MEKKALSEKRPIKLLSKVIKIKTAATSSTVIVMTIIYFKVLNKTRKDVISALLGILIAVLLQ
jgi:hypothetical protein